MVPQRALCYISQLSSKTIHEHCPSRAASSKAQTQTEAVLFPSPSANVAKSHCPKIYTTVSLSSQRFQEQTMQMTAFTSVDLPLGTRYTA